MSELHRIKQHHESWKAQMRKGWPARYTIHPDSVDYMIERIEKLEQQNSKLNKEIGKYSNAVYDLANAGYAIGEDARKLVNKMVGGYDNE